MIFPNTETDIPEELLKHQEEGRVVFFCGAGISYDAHIPVFGGLMKETAKKLNHEFSSLEKKLFKEKNYDQLYLMYERRVGDAIAVRKVSASILTPKLNDKEDELSKHISLLKLAKNKNGKTHLVTTNYDCLFDKAQDSLKQKIPCYSAPLLPVPKDYKWDGIVYLHSKLDENPSNENLESLVLSSADFGQAYLTERWASRFITELFRDHVICFVGYSVNDVIIKYMMDALTYERKMMKEGERQLLPIFAFTGYDRNYKKDCIDEWDMKGISAIPYRVSDSKGHIELTRVLEAWAKYHENGRMDKSAIVQCAMRENPDSVSDIGKMTIERVNWALMDKAAIVGLPNEVSEVTIKWLEHISGKLLDKEVGFSIISWIGKHAKYAESLQWCVRNEAYLTEDHRNTLFYLLPSSSGKLFDLWRLFLSSARRCRGGRYIDWTANRKDVGALTPGLRHQFKEMIQPTLWIKAVNGASFSREHDLGRYFEWNFFLDENIANFDDESSPYLAELIPELTVALLEACEIIREFDRIDFSYIHIPALERIDKELRYYGTEWYCLLVLLRNALLAVERTNRERILSILKQWEQYKYPSFYRLQLWAFSRFDDVSAEDAAEWLVNNEEALWCVTNSRELLCLFDCKMATLSKAKSHELQTLLLTPSSQFSPTEAEIATRLEHLKRAGVAMMPSTDEFLCEFANDNEAWNNRRRDIDGLCVFDDMDIDEIVGFRNEAEKSANISVPDSLEGAKEYFERLNASKCISDSVRLREWFSEHPVESLNLMFDLGDRFGCWPEFIWEEAFSSLMYKGKIEDSFDVLTDERVAKMPIALLDAIKITLAFWLQATAKLHLCSSASLFLCKRFLVLLGAGEEQSGIDNADAPFELVAETLMRNWFDTKPSLGSGIEKPYLSIFTIIAKGKTRGLEYARRELLRQIANLYAIDQKWTIENLVPLLSWEIDADRALVAWNEAVLCRRYEPKLLKIVWKDFAETARRFSQMSKTAQSCYADLLLDHSINVRSTFGKRQCTRILRDLSNDGREKVALKVNVRLDVQRDNQNAVWRNEIREFLVDVWPVEAEYISPKLFSYVADGIVYLDEDFPDAVDVMEKFAKTQTLASGFVHVLGYGRKDQLSHSEKHPEATLKMLSYIKDFHGATAQDIKECLDRIMKVRPLLEDNPEFRRLREVQISRTL